MLEEAEHEACLEESQLETDFNTPEATIMANRKENLELQEKMEEARKKVKLEKLDLNIKTALERFDFAKASLTMSAAAKIKLVEDDYAKGQLEREKERRQIEKDEKKMQDTLNRSKTDYAIFHADNYNALENLVASVQAPEMEEDQDQEEEEEEEEDEEDQDQEEEGKD